MVASNKNILISKENDIQSWGENYNKKIQEIKSKSISYLKNNNDKDFLELCNLLNKIRYDQIIFPKTIRNQKSLKDIKKASTSFYKIDKKIKAHNAIDKEILKAKKVENNQQVLTNNFDIYLKISKQNLISKANKIAYNINSIQLPLFDNRLNNILLEKRTKKLKSKIDKLAKKIEKECIAVASIVNHDDPVILKKIKKIHKNLDKFQNISKILPNIIAKTDDNRSNQHTSNSIDFINSIEKGRYLLNDIDNNNSILKILKHGNTESTVVETVQNINKGLQDKMNQFVEVCKQSSNKSQYVLQQKKIKN